MAICVTGMHRSGTSMAMSVLNGLGLDVGNENDLLGASPSNPEGHWENVQCLDLDDAVLNALGGGWDCPPDAGSRGFSLDTLAPLKLRARALRDELGFRAPWGWKDPRISLLLPFWFDVYPELKVVVCLRSPLEVAQSLRNRGSSSYRLGLALWKTYNERILVTSRSDQRLITHYLGYLQHPQIEIERLCSFLGLTPDKDQLEESKRRIKSFHRRVTLGMQEMLDADVPSDIIDLYGRMCREAGWCEGDESDGSQDLSISRPARRSGTDQTGGRQRERRPVNSLLLELGFVRRELSTMQRRERARASAQ